MGQKFRLWLGIGVQVGIYNTTCRNACRVILRGVAAIRTRGSAYDRNIHWPAETRILTVSCQIVRCNNSVAYKTLARYIISNLLGKFRSNVNLRFKLQNFTGHMYDHVNIFLGGTPER